MMELLLEIRKHQEPQLSISKSFVYLINTMAPIIGPILHTALAAVSWAKGRLDLFAIGDDHGMYHKSYSGTGWSPASGPW